MIEFFTKRKISKKTLERNKIAMEVEHGVPVIAFPYFRDGELINIKYRSLDKKFRQVKGAEKILYGLDDVKDAEVVIVVEGEIDKLSLEEAGYRNVVSVPDGAPAKVKEGELPPKDADKKFSFVWSCEAVFEYASRVVLATDNDEPGFALAEELARRIGREKCFMVKWPKDDQDWARKDANEVLVKDGVKHLRAFVEAAEPIPYMGLHRFAEYWDEIMGQYISMSTASTGYSTGWSGIDRYYRVVPGELTVVTGVPNSGKSEWLDALACNLTENYGWAFAFCAMEKNVGDHGRQLMEKHLKKPFFSHVNYAEGAERMSLEEVKKGIEWLDDWCHLIRCEGDTLPSVDWLLDLARVAVRRYGIRGLVIDPYNEIDHTRKYNMSETEFVSQMLSKIKRFAQHYGVHVWLVAHPRQLHNWQPSQVPSLYDISGSAHFVNKCDAGIVIHRNWDREQGGDPLQVCISVMKMRNKAAGTIGKSYLRYSKSHGTYIDMGDAGARMSHSGDPMRFRSASDAVQGLGRRSGADEVDEHTDFEDDTTSQSVQIYS
eukprot:evm.model.scf_905.1 EVM.evm.TU.scf_905.1   scf_905:1034-6209(-)